MNPADAYHIDPITDSHKGQKLIFDHSANTWRFVDECPNAPTAKSWLSKLTKFSAH